MLTSGKYGSVKGGLGLSVKSSTLVLTFLDLSSV